MTYGVRLVFRFSSAARASQQVGARLTHDTPHEHIRHMEGWVTKYKTRDKKHKSQKTTKNRKGIVEKIKKKWNWYELGTSNFWSALRVCFPNRRREELERHGKECNEHCTTLLPISPVSTMCSNCAKSLAMVPTPRWTEEQNRILPYKLNNVGKY